MVPIRRHAGRWGAHAAPRIIRRWFLPVVITASFVTLLALLPPPLKYPDRQQFERHETGDYTQYSECNSSHPTKKSSTNQHFIGDECTREHERYREEREERWQSIIEANGAQQAAEFARDQANISAFSLSVLIIALGASVWAAEASFRAARAADQTLKHEQWSVERDLRSYITVTAPSIKKLKSSNIFKIEFVARNNGKTPAYNTHWDWTVRVRRYPNSDRKWPTFDFSEKTHLEPLNPGQGIWGTLTRKFTDGQLEGLRRRTMSIFLCGEIRFRDAFGKDRWVKFRFRIDGEIGTKGRTLWTAADGNQTSEDDDRPFMA